jgi:hypothetical protein
VARVAQTVRDGDPDGFAALMIQGRNYLDDRTRKREVSEENR